ncbi:hypothetical protein OIU77_004591 [Salix suchowensis]|uniref:Endonuclease/exonuclease/phosphatase domain-containing protein n=1 Tax=Salix suchowensis TaxID=1278906 RepID=A0ABQ9AUX4_9ROSI|nr:hypothetical protein OIU77_004591 [Salix suchowensis]
MEGQLNLNGWNFISNATFQDRCRILVGWNSLEFSISCIHSSPQWITCEATSLTTCSTIRITFVYGFNSHTERKPLWDYLANSSHQFSSLPWTLLGDFNANLQPDQKVGGDARWLSHHEDFQKALHQAHLFSLPYRGMNFTWTNNQLGQRNIQNKLDWALGNNCLLQEWPASMAKFLPRSISDHSAIILHLSKPSSVRPNQFKFLNAWTHRDDYLPLISSTWQLPSDGNPMRSLLTKLQQVKAVLKSFHKHQTSNMSNKVYFAKQAWDQAQVALDMNPTDVSLQHNERTAATLYASLCKDEEAICKQKSRVQWLQLGDKNTIFFHKSVLHRQARNHVSTMQDKEGNQLTGHRIIGNMAADYFENLLNNTDNNFNSM